MISCRHFVSLWTLLVTTSVMSLPLIAQAQQSSPHHPANPFSIKRTSEYGVCPNSSERLSAVARYRNNQVGITEMICDAYDVMTYQQELENIRNNQVEPARRNLETTRYNLQNIINQISNANQRLSQMRENERVQIQEIANIFIIYNLAFNLSNFN